MLITNVSDREIGINPDNLAEYEIEALPGNLFNITLSYSGWQRRKLKITEEQKIAFCEAIEADWSHPI